MKKRLFGIATLLLAAVGLSGCHGIGEKATGLPMIYGAVAVISALLLVGCLFLVRQKKTWFVLLFSSVLVVNAGYTFLSLSLNLEMALWANRVSYLGSVFLPTAMLMIILNATNTTYKKWLPISLLALSVAVFLVAASPGILDIYYKEVSFEVVNGVATLKKVYGPLHPLYLFYLLGYFAAMVTVIIRAAVKKTVGTTAHAVILAIAVFVNIGVWLIEQLSKLEFEFLSVSYIISELFLLGVHLVMNENQRLRELAAKGTATDPPAKAVTEQGAVGGISSDAIKSFTDGLETLTPTERHIYEAYLNGRSTKEIMSELNIKENTLKFHNKNLYGKLGVSSRKQLVEIHKSIK